MKRWVTPGLGLSLLGVFLLIIYWPGFSGQWFLDDFGNIHENVNVHADSLNWESLEPALYGRSPSHHRLERPVAYLSLAVNYAIGGTDPVGYHVVNFLIHFLTTIAVYLLARKTLTLPALSERYGTSAHAVALLGALLWAVHPIQVTAVTYIVQRMAAMAALFSLLAMLFYVNGRTDRNLTTKLLWFGLCGVSALMAVGSKQNAVMLPVSLLFYDLIFLRNPGKRYRIGFLVWLVLAVVAIAVIGLYYAGLEVLTDGYANRPFTLSERLLAQPRALIYYLWLIVYPTSDQFALLHDFTIPSSLWSPWSTLPSAALLVLLAVLAIGYRRRAPLLCFAWLFFLANHIVESSVLPLELIFEHRNYLPTVFIFIAAGAGFLTSITYFSKSRLLKLLLIGGGAIVLFSIGHTTYMQNSLYENEIAFWADNVNKAPALHRPLHNLGAAYFSAKQLDLGVAVTEQAVAGKALGRKDQKWVSHYNLAKFYHYAGREDEALLQYKKVLELLPHHPPSLNGVARIMVSREDIGSALRYNTLALLLSPKDADAHATLGLIRLRQNQPQAAYREGRLAWNADRDSPLALFVMGEACRIMGNLDGASHFFHRSLTLSPSSYATILALIEIADAKGDQAGVRELAGRLFEQGAEKKIDRRLAAYQRQYNFMNAGRTERIAHAIRRVFAETDR